MAGTKPKKPDKKKTGLTAGERAAMRDRLRELKGTANGEAELLAKIREMPAADRAMAERLHAAITAAAPTLSPKTWYGMPAYARGGDTVCFFQSGAKFKARYATFGFTDKAKLDDGAMWPTAFALRELTAADLARLVALVKQAVG